MSALEELLREADALTAAIVGEKVGIAEAIRGLVIRAHGAGAVDGNEQAWSECETCGCAGMVEQSQTLPDGQTARVVMVKCPECDGTGVGALGQRLRQARETGARESLRVLDDAIADDPEECHLSVEMREAVEMLIASYEAAPLPDDGATPDQIAAARKEGAATMLAMAARSIADLLRGLESAVAARLATLELP